MAVISAIATRMELSDGDSAENAEALDRIYQRSMETPAYLEANRSYILWRDDQD